MARGFEANATEANATNASALHGATQAETGDAATSSLFGQLQFDEFAASEDHLDPLTGEPKTNKNKPGEQIAETVTSLIETFGSGFAKIVKTPEGSVVEDYNSRPTPGYKHFDRGSVEERKESAFTLIPHGGVQPKHIQQGSIGDCYLLAALAHLAYHDPKHVESIIRRVDKDTATVCFFHRGEPQLVYVDFSFISDSAAPYVISNVERHQARIVTTACEDVLEVKKLSLCTAVVWPAVVEKAYARFVEAHGRDFNENPLDRAFDNFYDHVLIGTWNFMTGKSSAYQQMEGGRPSVAGRRLGKEADERYGPPTLAMLKQNRVMSVWRRYQAMGDPTDGFLSMHAYAVLGTQWVANARGEADLKKSIVSLYNPHGTVHAQTVEAFMRTWTMHALSEA